MSTEIGNLSVICHQLRKIFRILLAKTSKCVISSLKYLCMEIYKNIGTTVTMRVLSWPSVSQPVGDKTNLGLTRV